MNWKKHTCILMCLLASLVLMGQACNVSPAATSIPPITTPEPAPYELKILHTSENHGHWKPVEVSKVSQGGIARRATLIEKLRSEATNSLLLDSGDISMGTLYFSLYKGSEGRDFYNMLGYDAIVPGNHDFDLGPQAMSENLLAGSQFSTVLANLDISGEPFLAGKIQPSVVKTIGGEKVGLFGLITDEVTVTSNPGPNVKMKDTLQAARNAVAELSRQGVNKIILLSHLGYPADLDLAGRVNGIDVIISGHTDTLMGDPAQLDSSLGQPVSSYPAVIKSPDGGTTLIAHAYIWGRLVGDLDLVFNGRGEISRWEGRPVFIDKSIAEKASVAQKLTEMDVELGIWGNRAIGQTTIELDGRRAVVRNQESNLGDLVADAMLWYTRQDGTQIAIANGGGIRASFKAGTISYGQVLEALPFGNRMVQFDIYGADIIAALENGLSEIKSDPEASGGRFPQVAGIKFSADLKQPAGSRITGVEVGSNQSGFQPLAKDGLYRLVTLDFMYNGGDGYTMLKNGKNLRGGDVPQDMALITYLQTYQSISPDSGERITLSK